MMMGLLPVLPMNVELIVIALAVGYTLVLVLIQRKLTNPKRMREIQYKVKEIQKEMNEMAKNKAPQDALMAKQKEIMPLMGEQMKTSMKASLVIFPLFLVMYYVIIPSVPLVSANVNASKSLFFIIVFALGIASAIIITLYDRSMSKKEKNGAEAGISGTA